MLYPLDDIIQTDNGNRCSPGGIGNALAREFHAQGLRVLATARKTDTIQDLKDLGIETLSLVVDDQSSIDACRKQVNEALGKSGLSYLVNNAGRSESPSSLLHPLSPICQLD